jgi:hypothetical protein
MKSTFGAVIVGWFLVCGILAVLALAEFRSHFSEQRHYFVWFRNPGKLTGSEEDQRAREALEEAANRNLLQSAKGNREFMLTSHLTPLNQPAKPQIALNQKNHGL